MSKEKEKMLYRRKCQIKAMDELIRNCDNRSVQAGWNDYTANRTYPDIAADDQLYHTCCSYFRYIINEVFWEAEE